MNRHHGTSGPQMGRNNLLHQYNRFAASSVPFASNPMLASNPMYSGNIRDPNFYNRINMAKIEQIKKAKSVGDFGLDKRQLIEYVICPMTVNRTPSDVIEREWGIIEQKFLPDRDEFQKGRTNQPYKNILKNENYSKTFETAYDLIVHKVTDEDKLGLIEDFEKLMSIIERHNKQLKMIFSISEKGKHLKEFEYTQKYKYRLQYNPKDFDDLKDFHKKEQQKIAKEKRHIDEILNTLIETEVLTDRDIIKLNKELEEEDNTENEIRDIEDELREELGEDFDDIMNQLDSDSENSEIEEKPKKKKITIKSEEKPKKKFTVKSISKESIKEIDKNSSTDDLKNKYKNRTKQKEN